jgi:hypothetical protein
VINPLDIVVADASFQGKAYDLNLFTPALLCSKAVIYNRTGGLLIDAILRDLGMVTQARQRLKKGQSEPVTGRPEGVLDGGRNDVPDPVNSKPQFAH